MSIAEALQIERKCQSVNLGVARHLCAASNSPACDTLPGAQLVSDNVSLLACHIGTQLEASAAGKATKGAGSMQSLLGGIEPLVVATSRCGRASRQPRTRPPSCPQPRPSVG